MNRPRLKFVVEGETEEQVVKQLLGPHLRTKGFLFEPGDGDLLVIRGNHWDAFRAAVGRCLQHRSEWVVATTLYDLYAIQQSKLGIGERLASATQPAEKARIAEEAMRAHIGDERFVPHVSLFEMEALIFTDLSKAAGYRPEWSAALTALGNAVKHLSPEEIDDGAATAPSKRLIAALTLPRFTKRTDVPPILRAIGLGALRAACPHFDGWLDRLEAKLSTT